MSDQVGNHNVGFLMSRLILAISYQVRNKPAWGALETMYKNKGGDHPAPVAQLICVFVSHTCRFFPDVAQIQSI